jgi:beta-lactamase regulating signal transducer with metallopeptidase domain
MNTTFFYFLIESSVYLLFFLAIYKLAISNLTHFTWMRTYLLSSLTLSIILPLIRIPGQWAQSIIGDTFFEKPFSFNILNPMNIISSETSRSLAQAGPVVDIWTLMIMTLSAIYLIGVLFKSVTLCKNLMKIREIIRNNNNNKHQEGIYWIVKTDNGVAAFSFFNYIFINKDYKNLTHDEFQKIIKHERIHVKQWHTIDILFVEIISILFWFSPLVGYTKNRIKEIHEYIADEKTAGIGEMKKNYAQLLFNLASEAKTFSLMTGFSSKQISNRILMVSKTRSLPVYKLSFIAIIPVAALLLLSFSYLDNTNAKFTSKSGKQEISSGLTSSSIIGNINWENNTVFSSAELNKILALKKGDEYVKENIEKRVNQDVDGVTTLYLDKGYLFANIKITEIPVSNGAVDLTFTVFEGARGKIDKIGFKGNQKITYEDLLKKITIKTGDWFSKTKLVQSVRALSMMDKIDPESIKPSVHPGGLKSDSKIVSVDLMFELTEK